MEDADFSDEFCRFVQLAIPSVEAAEILLFLQKTPDRAWAIKEIVDGLRTSITITEAHTVKCIETLQARGFVAVDPERRAQYRPGSAGLEEFARMLEQAYVQRPVTLIRMIYALRDTRIQSFADAFQIRKS
ncbi:MAG TPA: hypothetical protein VMN03_01025 [Burkholderiales bacterium]|nr:hypothetical protein [Burkholderiales bacterium]